MFILDGINVNVDFWKRLKSEYHISNLATHFDACFTIWLAELLFYCDDNIIIIEKKMFFHNNRSICGRGRLLVQIYKM